MKKYFSFALIGILAASMAFTGCSDDDDDDNATGNANINHQEKWIGAACSCDGKGCELMNVPIPAPQENAKLIGCENIDTTGIEGGKVVCLRTISAELSAVAPTVYAPGGYCSISAVKAEMSEADAPFAQMASYGDPDKMTSCPAGSALLTSVFDYQIVGRDAKITNKTCVKLCNSDADCNTAGEMTCLNKKGVKFCYNETNLKLSENYTLQPF